MPKGKIVLKDNLGEHHVSGGCLACYGRYENQTDEAFHVLQSKLKKKLPAESHPSSSGWRGVVSEHVEHVTIKVGSICSNKNLVILSEGTEENAMMDVVFAALANDSIWADAFITKAWADREMEYDEILMNPHVKAELMISAMSVLRRTCQHWYKLQHEYMVEKGLNYESSLFYAILATSGGVEDWSGEEQVLPLRCFNNAQLAAFLEGDFAPSNLDDFTYAQCLGYSQEILAQWEEGTNLQGDELYSEHYWTDNIGMNPFQSVPVNLTEEGNRLSGDRDYYFKLLSGSKKGVHIFEENPFAKILGVAGKKVESELKTGKFGNHLYYDIKSAIDVAAGLTYLKEEVLANG